jgi:outer membrane protein assembly factor BamB
MRSTSLAHRLLVSAAGIALSVAPLRAAPAKPKPSETKTPAAAPGPLAAEILKATGVQGGFVVHVGCGDAQLTAALHRNSSFQVHGLERNPAKVAAARERLLSEKIYGPVAIEHWTGDLLPYIDNLVNLLVVEDTSSLAKGELERVLVPDGVAYIRKGGKWQKIAKPRPAEMDDWSHYFYDAKGNPASHDLIVAPPERLQWVGNPRWSRHHDRMSSLSAQVSGGGRLFYIMDEGSRISALLPSHWTLTARDAFNGTVLWKKPIERWQPHLWPLKSGPTQLARRLVADGPRVFVTLNIDAPVSCLDGATGESLRVYESTKGAEEILHCNGVLYVLVNPKTWALEDFAPKLNNGDQKRVEGEYQWDEQPRQLHALDPATGKELWRKEGKIAPLTLATDGTHVVYHDGERLVCLAAASGEQRWTGSAAKRKLFEYNYGPRIVLHGNSVLYAGGDGAMKGLNSDTGAELWSAPHNKSGYRSPEDLIVAGGLVWNAPTSSGSMSGEFIGRDPLTGESKSQFKPDVDTYWFHHRCYIAKATDRFILPSRTGIEFVDFKAQHWDINHWVRGACLYGSMPCNGLLYAGPHNCACYPEAKLDGLNALAPKTPTPNPKAPAESARLLKGPAYQKTAPLAADAKDWPTYRHDNSRSGFTDQELLSDLGKSWEVALEGRLSAVTIAAQKVFVSQIDAHTLHALDLNSGKSLWHFVAGGRIDSPPTFWNGYVLFGCKDGAVYSLRAEDGALAWRYKPSADRRHMAFEQLESVWPIHGSVLVEKDTVSFVAGRSVFLDGGLRFFKLDAASGSKLAEELYDDKDPETGRDLQERLQTLQMPVGLNDILSSDGKWTYLRTQKIGPDGKRVEIGPVSGNAVQQGASQRGEGAHLFAPMGFLDDSWFHRSYWVYGRSFAGGHNGYYQAGKYTPAGRILVFNNDKVFGYGREPQYYKWTTTMEHQLFSADRSAPDVAPQDGEDGPKKKKNKSPQLPGVKFPDSPKLDPSGKPITVEAWILADHRNGVILAHGGPQNGYALALRDGEPVFYLRSEGALTTASAKAPLTEGWHHLAGVLDKDLSLRIYVDGRPSGEATATSLLHKKPAQPLEVGVDSGGSVGDYPEAFGFKGLIDELAVAFRALTPEEIRQHAATADSRAAIDTALACSFDKGDARDSSGNALHGVASGVDNGKGKNGGALWFRAAKSNEKGNQSTASGRGPAKTENGSFVQFDWNRYVPVMTQAMAMAGSRVLVAGPPDLVNEEYAFERLSQKDPAIHHDLAEQDAALMGERGATVQMVGIQDGEVAGEFPLDRPPVWDGMAIAHGRIFVSTTDGKVQCYGRPQP